MNKIRQIIDRWFYTEPLLFSICTTHTLLENPDLQIPMRSGQKRIEYSPQFFIDATDEQTEEFLKIEIYRILLQHPYKRQPHNANKTALILASDIAINKLYKTRFIELSGVRYFKDQESRFKMLDNPLGDKWSGSEEEKFFLRNLNTDRRTGNLETIDDLTFEEWYTKINFLIKNTAASGGKNAGTDSGALQALSLLESTAELWEENQDAQKEIQDNIKKVIRDQGWGSTGGGLSRAIEASADFSMNYRRILSQFRNNIVSSKRNLTRMKPNRRFGFRAMGSRYEQKTNILIAVDVSGSITDESFARFFHAINNFFIFGIEKMDLIFFDVNLKFTRPVSFKKKINLKEIAGRGGTNFQIALDFYKDHKEYNGLIIFTDGQGNPPSVSGFQNILWILSTRMDWENSRRWISTLPGNKSTYLPF